ncbi:MAG: Butyryltransferase [Mucilaginibacter sp.]|nr:Butyryltransferase [Mucilaginibacter sp.]
MIENKIRKYGIEIELVEIHDAEFIVELRNNKRNKHISKTDSRVSEQVTWISNYKLREANNLEYYFIVKDIAGNKWGTTRLYNFDGTKFDVGSWVFLPNSPSGIAIKSDIITRELAFEVLGFTVCKFDVRKDNKNVLRYHYTYKPIKVAEDDLNFYFELDKQSFFNQRDKIINLL